MSSHHYNQSEIEQMIQDCENLESKLSDWENGFMSSIGDVVDKNMILSENQVNKLNDIWERIT